MKNLSRTYIYIVFSLLALTFLITPPVIQQNLKMEVNECIQILNTNFKNIFSADNYSKMPKEEDWSIKFENNKLVKTFINEDEIQFKEIWELEGNILNCEIEIINNSQQSFTYESKISAQKKIQETPGWSFGILQTKDWIAINERNFICAMLKNEDKINSTNDEIYKENKITLNTTESKIENAKFFIGPKQIGLFTKTQEFPNLEHSIEFGFLKPITKPVLLAFEIINNLTKNPFIALLILFLIIYLLLLPISIELIKHALRYKKASNEIEQINKNLHGKIKEIALTNLFAQKNINQILSQLNNLLPLVMMSILRNVCTSFYFLNKPFLFINDFSMPEFSTIFSLVDLGITTAIIFIIVVIYSEFFTGKANILLNVIFAFFYRKVEAGSIICFTSFCILNIILGLILKKKHNEL